MTTQLKPTLRRTAQTRRTRLQQEVPDFAQRITEFDLNLPAGAIVAGYSAIRSEANPYPLMCALAEAGHPMALPCVLVANEPLIFRRWSPRDALQAGAYGITEPGPDAETVIPDVLLVPLLGYDANGFRLGYGGGYYDRTLETLRAQKKVLAIGIAYAGQELPEFTADSHDQPLDAILTELGLHRFSQV